MSSNVKNITEKEALNIVGNYQNDEEDVNESLLGKYWYKSKNKYVAIDNNFGDCFVEEFNNLSECMDYLNGSNAILAKIKKL